MPNGMTGAAGVVVTTLFGTTLLAPSPPPEVSHEPLRFDSALLSTWTSEQIVSNTDEPLDHECAFFNFSRSYASAFCDPFTISRMQASTIRAAADRALRCAAKHEVECVLSAEVGFAVPAAFIAQHGASDEMLAVVAPRVVAATPPPSSDAVPNVEYVRVTPPGVGAFESRTVRFNTSIEVEFMTAAKRVEARTVTGSAAFCVQFLRLAFTDECWEQLDRV
jgi:hypothetical protein